jgi:hypothetical protein
MKKPLLKEGYGWDEVTQKPEPILRLRELRRLRRLIEKGEQARSELKNWLGYDQQKSLRVIDGDKPPQN